MSLPSSTNCTNNSGKPEPEGKEPISRDLGQSGSAHQVREPSKITSAADETSGAVKGLKNEIPRKAIYRLSMYLRCLAKIKEDGRTMVSSEALSKAAGVKPTQLRKDLTYFGKFGARGRGYDV